MWFRSPIASRLATALQERLREGYSKADFFADLMAGTVVGLVAIPLGMALAIAINVPPQQGLYTVVVAGVVVALLGGSRFQVTGPTAAFVVILAPIVKMYGLSGLLVAGVMAGTFLVVMGLTGFGKFIQFIPYPVTTGFTAGIAIVIATIQLKDFFGLTIVKMPDHYLDRIATLISARKTASPLEFLVGASTLALLIIWPRLNKRIPSPLIALGVVAAAVYGLRKLYPSLDIATIGNQFAYVTKKAVYHGIPGTLPHLDWPWNFHGVRPEKFKFTVEAVQSLVLPAFTIAILGSIESLLSATVADAMTRTKHNPDSELVALGIGNMICPFFGGIAATGAIARTATNIRFGAQSPISSVIHSAFTLLAIIFFAPIVSELPMASLAALLIVVAWNMSDAKHIPYLFKIAPRSDIAIFLICFLLTVVFDMVVGVTVGVVLAAFLFMRRMAIITHGKILAHGDIPEVKQKIPHDVIVYQIAGPLFFGAAMSAMETLGDINDRVRAVIFVMNDVPVMDLSGLVAFESTVKMLAERNQRVLVVGVKPQPAKLFHRTGHFAEKLEYCASIEAALNKVG